MIKDTNFSGHSQMPMNTHTVGDQAQQGFPNGSNSLSTRTAVNQNDSKKDVSMDRAQQGQLMDRAQQWQHIDDINVHHHEVDHQAQKGNMDNWTGYTAQHNQAQQGYEQFTDQMVGNGQIDLCSDGQAQQGYMIDLQDTNKQAQQGYSSSSIKS